MKKQTTTIKTKSKASNMSKILKTLAVIMAAGIAAKMLYTAMKKENKSKTKSKR